MDIRFVAWLVIIVEHSEVKCVRGQLTDVNCSRSVGNAVQNFVGTLDVRYSFESELGDTVDSGSHYD